MRRKKKDAEIKIEPEIIEEKVVEEVSDPVLYMVGAGETLDRIAKKFKTTPEKIKELNGITEIFPTNQIRIK